MRILASIAAGLASLWISCASAFTTQPADGLWSVDSERNLAIGRAFNIEVAGSYGIVTFYNYNANGAPTFYVGAALLATNNTLSVGLSEPTGGTCLGCSPRSGSVLSSPGTALFEFTSSVTGFVTLPHEGRKAISKGAVTWPQTPTGLYGVWLFNLVSSTGSSVSSYLLGFNRMVAGTANGDGIAMDTTSLWGCEYQVRGSAAGYTLCVKLFSSGTADRAVVVRWWGNRMDGIWQYQGLTTTAVFSGTRLVNGNNDQVVLKARADGVDNDISDSVIATLRNEIEALATATGSGASGNETKR